MSTPVTETVDKGKSKVAFARRAQNWVMAFLIVSLLCGAALLSSTIRIRDLPFGNRCFPTDRRQQRDTDSRRPSHGRQVRHHHRGHHCHFRLQYLGDSDTR